MTDPLVSAASPVTADAPRPGGEHSRHHRRHRRWRALARSAVVVAGLALAGYALLLASGVRDVAGMAAWFAGSVIGHDLVLFPAYAVVDRVVVAVLGIPSVAARLPISPLNYLRMPTIGSLLLFCLSFPGIVRQGGHSYAAATGQTQQPFLGRWLVAVGVMYVLSGLVYAARLASTRRRLDSQAAPHPEGSGGHVARTRG